MAFTTLTDSALHLLVAATTTPTPTPVPISPDPKTVTPGVAGFLVMFVLALVTWLLLRNMTARLRRMRFREQDTAAASARSQGAVADGAAAGGSQHPAPQAGPDVDSSKGPGSGQ